MQRSFDQKIAKSAVMNAKYGSTAPFVIAVDLVTPRNKMGCDAQPAQPMVAGIHGCMNSEVCTAIFMVML